MWEKCGFLFGKLGVDICRNPLSICTIDFFDVVFEWMIWYNDVAYLVMHCEVLYEKAFTYCCC